MYLQFVDKPQSEKKITQQLRKYKKMKFSQIFTATASLIIFNQACSKLIEIERSQHFLKNEDLERIFGENADQTGEKDKSCYQILQITDPQIGMRDQSVPVFSNEPVRASHLFV